MYAGSFVIADCGYVCGGYLPSCDPSNECYRYDSVTDTWTAMADMLLATAQCFGFALGGYGYIVGGWPTSGVTAKVQRYDPVSDSWEYMNDYGGGSRYGLTGFVIDGVQYVGTGCDASGFETCDWWRYNEGDDTWTAMASLPDDQYRSHAYGFAIDGYGYVASGQAQASIYKYNPVADSWSFVEDDLPYWSSYSCSQTPVFNDKARLFYGYLGGSTQHTIIFDPDIGITYDTETYVGYGGVNNGAVMMIGTRCFMGLDYSEQWWEYEPGYPPDAIVANVKIAYKSDRSSYLTAHNADTADGTDNYFAAGQSYGQYGGEIW